MSEFKEAVVLIAKCGESHKSYGIRMEKTGADRWLTTWAFPIKDSSAKREGYDKIQVKGDISFSDDYPGSVSYTHLDVYKRQHRQRSLRAGRRVQPDFLFHPAGSGVQGSRRRLGRRQYV